MKSPAEIVKRLRVIDKWIEWNNKMLSSHGFCMYYEAMYRKEIRERIKQKLALRDKIKREMVRDE